jgi:hypothetical protein
MIRPVLALFLISLLTSACGAPKAGSYAPAETPLLITETIKPPTAPAPTPTPTLTPEPTAKPEDAYYQSLTDEQKALFNQTKDMQAEGFTRQFLTETGLTSYLAYYDKDGEVAFVWNFEQGKLNPALKIENNLLINETSGSYIIWNPNLDRAEAQKTLADYFRYARARIIAAAQGVRLGNTLESALNNPIAQEYLENGRNVTFPPTSGRYTNIDGTEAKFKVPTQRIFISGETPIVFRTVQDIDGNMTLFSAKSEGQRRLRGLSFEQNPEGVLYINYFNAGPDYLGRFGQKYRDYILSSRIASVLESTFSRAKGGQPQGLIDPVTTGIVYNSNSILDGPVPLAIYSQTR